jgi:hypothetical protein
VNITSATSAVNSELLMNIDGIDEPTITRYFSSLNSGEFTATSELFADRGQLSPPFDKPIEGRAAIAKYLTSEARGMRFYPESGAMLIRDDNLIQYHVQGQVKTKYFTINVSWLMQLNADLKIVLMEVKILAALEELLKLSGNTQA